MQYVSILLLTLFLTACSVNSTPTPASPAPVSVSVSIPAAPTTSLPAGLPQTDQTTDLDDLTIAEENSIVGEYTLKRGTFSHGEIHQEINEGYLVIEELEVNNYGYYYVTMVEKTAPETHSGIFYEKGGKFVQKVIYNEGSEEDKTSKSQIMTIDNIKITYDENILKIIIDSNKKETTIWERSDGVISKSETLEKALNDAQYDYIKYYKEKCISGLECADKAYTPVNE